MVCWWGYRCLFIQHHRHHRLISLTRELTSSKSQFTPFLKVKLGNALGRFDKNVILCNTALNLTPDIKQIIDYHVELRPGNRCRVGDTALLGYRTQMQMTRSYIAPVSGLSGKREVRLHYVFDLASTALDEHYDPVDPAKVRQDIDKTIEMYA